MPTVIITCFDILYTIYLRLCLKKRPPHNKKRFRIQKSPGVARDVITTTISRYRRDAKNLQYHIFAKNYVTAKAAAFAALQYDFIIYRELSCLRN